MGRSHPRPSSIDDQRGQVLVLFALMVTVLLLLSTLLFDAANALVTRRRLQDSADAAALKAASLLLGGSVSGCAPAGSSSPRKVVEDTAIVAANANATDSVTVSCPSGWNNIAVKVRIETSAPSFFGLFFGRGDMAVSAEGTAVNGGVTGGKFSVVELNPYNPSWPNAYRGCPSVLISGGPDIAFDGSVHVDSACPASGGGALATNGNAATLTFNNGAGIWLVGGFSPGPLVITPYPQTNQPTLKDPLAGLPAIPISSLPVRRSSRLTVSNSTVVLEPGVYTGGIRLNNTSVAFLHPGIYVIDGGGIDLGAQSAMFSIAASSSGFSYAQNEPAATTAANWNANCPTATCGVLIYNTGTTSSLSNLALGGGTALMLRPYHSNYDGTGTNRIEYDKLLFWQSASPVPTSSYSQPEVQLHGGGAVDLSGTVYAPSAKVYLTGGSGGSGGSNIDLTIQFISWDLELNGNSYFHFLYEADAFAEPLQYGLVR